MSTWPGHFLVRTPFVHIVCLLAWGVAAVGGAQEKDRPCGREIAISERSTLPGCPAHSACASVSQRLTVCHCAMSPESEDIVVSRDGREVQRWNESVSGLFAHEIRVTAAHLDADTVEGLVVATREGLSMGMVRQYWAVCAISGAHLGSPPDCVDVEDYGVMGYLTGTSDRCRLLQTHWRDGSEPGRGGGLYLVGRWLGYDQGRFTPDPSRPLLARRYLNSFERERASASAPLLWYLDKRTRPVICPDPLCG